MKKILSMVLVFVLLFTVTSFAEDILLEFEDVKKYSIMNFNENGSIGSEELFTRAEMVQTIVNAAGLSGVDSKNISGEGFLDVNDNNLAYDAIIIAQSLGIVNGNGDGTFAPDDNVTYEQAIKMAVILLGYEPLALQRGGYPSGYLAAAKQFGITDGIKFKSTDDALKYDIAVLMQNALNTPIMEQISYGEVAEYAILDGNDGRAFVTLKNNLE